MSRGSVPLITLAQIEFGLLVQALDEWFMPKVHDTLSSLGVAGRVHVAITLHPRFWAWNAPGAGNTFLSWARCEQALSPWQTKQVWQTDYLGKEWELGRLPPGVGIIGGMNSLVEWEVCLAFPSVCLLRMFRCWEI